VRPLTEEATKFVRAMLDKDASPTDKLKALQVAAQRHVKGYTDAMSGKGIDRHLFALYVVSVGKSVDSAFLKKALSVPWKLSTRYAST
jgi:carnitine O-palmitoyltransferase 1